MENDVSVTNLDVSVESAGAAAAVGDAAGLLVDGGQARGGRRRALRVALHARQQDAAERGLSGRMEHQLRGEAWKGKHFQSDWKQQFELWEPPGRISCLPQFSFLIIPII